MDTQDGLGARVRQHRRRWHRPGRLTKRPRRFFSSSGYVFRFWNDDRRRLKLLVSMHAGGYFAFDAGSDLGMNANALGVGLAYEAPF